MIARGNAGWLGQEAPDARWQSFGVSLFATAVLFAAALVAMQSIAPWHTSAERVEPPEVVHLTPPAIVPPRVLPQPSRPAPTTAAPQTVPTTIPPVVATPTPAITTPIITTSPIVATPSRAQADSNAGRSTTGAASATSAAPTARAGAPIAPAGVVLPPRTPNTPQVRDSIARSVMANIAEMARTYVPTGEVKAELDQSQAAAKRLAYRSTTVGNAAGIHTMLGQGKDGVGAVGNPNGGFFSRDGATGVSIPFPFLSPGPSPAQRKRDSVINAGNQARFARLAGRAKQQRAVALTMTTRLDSLRLDSLRRDSLRADSLRRVQAHARVP